MQKRSIISTLLLALLLALGSTALLADSHGGADPRAGQVEQAINDAEAAREKAGSVDGEWRDTAKMIESARKALAAGEYDKAMKLAREAHQQGVLGYEQAMSQQELRIPSYLKY
ncbi:MAG: hypothetical protein AB2814_09760 [Candidatus Sedimenticola endophacoides]|nr:MAG: hypothetical protein B0D94_10595 [Candidatus Sedimenticola endophacoides]OQX37649.1 MAG: hypothetical protein B0D96_01760 [Candidatus Sedimenticola endophacoides]OQX39096.1 MAG: hypothetical protein B0D89_11435 [Candidatus Sedimenticola endophacoides]OQX41792.1 MAG: hypothetical protein B0D82_01945 [Candidatus Sedimenticola endophacoides]OQX42061.1 MAG: hypothetical protein B0D88_07070 [Candidatus Sedimenticola endophacoides]